MSNYKLPILVTYRFRISMRYAGIRRGEVASPNGLGNPTPTEDYASVLHDYTISKSKCYSRWGTCNELHYYEPTALITY